MKKEFKMSQSRFDELQKELTYLKTTRSDEVAEMIKVARGFGDLSENSEYDEAKNEQAIVEARIVEIEQMLKSVTILDESGITTDAVSVGSVVTVRNQKNGRVDTYKIVGSTEASPRDKRISDESPVGKALLGRGINESVDVETPMGIVTYDILEIGK